MKIRGKVVLVFCLAETILASLLAFTESRSYYVEREQQLYVAANQANFIESTFQKTLSKVFTLEALVVENNGSTDFFDDNAEYIFHQKSGISDAIAKNIALAPNGVVEKVYPYAGNESLVGLDYFDSSIEGNASAIESLNQGKLVLSNPFQLKQGGIGIACRLPVYLNDGEIFWGIVTVTFDFNNLIDMFNFDNLEKGGSYYEVSYLDDNKNKTVIAKSDAFNGDNVKYSFEIYNLKWNISVQPSDYWINPAELILGVVITLVFSTGIAYISYSRNKIANTNVILKQIANKDNLTSCFSRNYVNEYLLDITNNEWIDKKVRHSMAIVDVDDFKSINDTYGHNAGDRALVMIANELKKACIEKNHDCAIRYGGDEFILLFGNVTEDDMKSRLGTLIANINSIRFRDIPELRLTVSVGATVSTNEINTYDDLFSASDKKIYISKSKGKNQFTL